jgi:hypothetical protein
MSNSIVSDALLARAGDVIKNDGIQGDTTNGKSKKALPIHMRCCFLVVSFLLEWASG